MHFHLTTIWCLIYRLWALLALCAAECLHSQRVSLCLLCFISPTDGGPCCAARHYILLGTISAPPSPSYPLLFSHACENVEQGHKRFTNCWVSSWDYSRCLLTSLPSCLSLVSITKPTQPLCPVGGDTFIYPANNFLHLLGTELRFAGVIWRLSQFSLKRQLIYVEGFIHKATPFAFHA